MATSCIYWRIVHGTCNAGRGDAVLQLTNKHCKETVVTHLCLCLNARATVLSYMQGSAEPYPSVGILLQQAIPQNAGGKPGV
eukprot:jgi/Chrzof1/14729/Cz09g13200.t1